MSQIAFFYNTTPVYWSGIVTALAVLAALLAAMGLQLLRGKYASEMAYFLFLALPLSFAGARFVHWYCFYRQYSGLFQAFSDFSVGGFHLVGAIAGTLLAALLTKLLRITASPLSLLDTLSPAAALGIGAGRFAAAFSSYDRGSVVFTDPALQRLPYATEVSNGLGGTDWRAAVFLWEGIATLLIAVILLLAFLSDGHGKKARPTGMLFALFMLLFGAAEIFFDSMRYDSAFLRSNGFVSLLQIVGAVTMIAELVICSSRIIRRRGFRRRFVFAWFVFLAGLGLTGYMEYFVQRHSDRYVFCYSLMAVGLAVCTADLLLLLRSYRLEYAREYA